MKDISTFSLVSISLIVFNILIILVTMETKLLLFQYYVLVEFFIITLYKLFSTLISNKLYYNDQYYVFRDFITISVHLKKVAMET